MWKKASCLQTFCLCSLKICLFQKPKGWDNKTEKMNKPQRQKSGQFCLDDKIRARRMKKDGWPTTIYTQSIQRAESFVALQCESLQETVNCLMCLCCTNQRLPSSPGSEVERRVAGQDRCNVTSHCLEDQRWFSTSSVFKTKLQSEKKKESGGEKPSCPHTVWAVRPCRQPSALPSVRGLVSVPHFCWSHNGALFEGSLGTCSVCPSTPPPPARYFWPSAAQLSLAFCQSQTVLGAVTGPQMPQQSLAIRPKLGRNHGSDIFAFYSGTKQTCIKNHYAQCNKGQIENLHQQFHFENKVSVFGGSKECLMSL